jgi:hypothetical protein
MPESRRDEPGSDVSAVARETLRRLETYCRARDWTGSDPYDALNSEVFARTPLIESRIARLAFTQLLKRSPIDPRRVLRIRPRPDPKATALFLAAYVRLAHGGDQAGRTTAEHLAHRLLALRSPRTPYWCWGYSFPWQTRHRLVPRFAPNIVTTSFAANALLDAHELGLGRDCLAAALSAGEYIVNELFWEDGPCAAFAYPLPDIRVPIHNASFLGAALLCRLVDLGGPPTWADVALAVSRYSAAAQRDDGSWPYGVADTQQWVDNFHTGYNLCALRQIAERAGTPEFEPIIRRGYAFYRRHFIRGDGAARYYHDRTYPVDAHAVAQTIITLCAMQDLDDGALACAQKVLGFALAALWDSRGFFHYRRLRLGRLRTSQMRWSQAWMMLAMLALLEGDGRGPGAPTMNSESQTRSA